MMKRSRAWLLLTIAVAACKAQSGSDVPPEVGPPAGLTEMVVVWGTRGLDRGDTVFVDLSDVPDDLGVDYYSGGRLHGTLPLEALGPTAPSTMIVISDRLNVRRCRSTGCSLVGYLERGQTVEVREYAGGWYRVTVDGEPRGYVYAQFLRLPFVYGRNQLQLFKGRMADYFERNLERLTVDGGQPVFGSYKVHVDDELNLVSFDFFTRYRDGPALQATCEAMRGIASFVRQLMAEVPSEVFGSYSAGIYYGTAKEVMVAGLADQDVFCLTPN
ncbi:MAG: SH3 domain-containing protein [Gemmatimonadota bacterium]|nr:MAG: SH3 domain-containing protein [Gemmatimonadota bacterium]